MRWIILASMVGCGGSPKTASSPSPESGPCVPGTGSAAVVAGKWHAPVKPSDFFLDLDLQGTATAICGSGSYLIAMDQGTFQISGTERRLRWTYSAGILKGTVVDYEVAIQDATHLVLSNGAGTTQTYLRE